MVAFEKNLAASADAHELVTELSKARAGIAGAGKHEDGHDEDGAVESAAESRAVI